MATAQLTFDLNDHDDRMAHLRCVKSTDMAIVLFELSNNLKKSCEVELERLPNDKYEILDMVFEKISDLLHENNINLEEIIE